MERVIERVGDYDKPATHSGWVSRWLAHLGLLPAGETGLGVAVYEEPPNVHIPANNDTPTTANKTGPAYPYIEASSTPGPIGWFFRLPTGVGTEIAERSPAPDPTMVGIGAVRDAGGFALDVIHHGPYHAVKTRAPAASFDAG